MQTMPKHTTALIPMLCLLLAWHTPTLIAQSADNNTITFKAPSEKYVDIVLQSHDGLIRLGDIYYHRGVTLPTNPQAFNALVNMKYITELYVDMDQTKITKRVYNGTTDKKSENSNKAQDHLLRLASLLCTETELNKYFCPENAKKPCTFIDTYGRRKPIGFWGGDRGNEFAQLRSYKAFVKDHLSELQDWSKTFFENDELIAYVVSMSSVADTYDFQKKGYWISGAMAGSSQVIDYLSFVPYDENQRNLNQRKLLLSIEPAKAKELKLQKRSPIFIVAKAKIYPDEKTPRSGARVPFAFELENPVLEIYKDIQLTQKIGEISVDNLITKY
ncbi:hypothetical protein [Eudoraea algarum]|uniref:hypothetical protein n=1 Tax=Eudoraea algarum TaxID=3417568 RepID=UPI003F5D547E